MKPELSSSDKKFKNSKGGAKGGTLWKHQRLLVSIEKFGKTWTFQCEFSRMEKKDHCKSRAFFCLHKKRRLKNYLSVD